MTICIGALCQHEEAGDTVVLASDRMVTWSDTEYEYQVPKAYPIGPAALVLIDGVIETGDRIVRVARSMLPGDAVAGSVETIAQVAAKCYADARTELIVAINFAPRQLSIEDYYRLQQQLRPELTGLLDNALASFDLGVSLLVAGVDAAGGHLHLVVNPGGYQWCHDAVGMSAIGSGAVHATQSLIGFGHTPKEPVKDTVFRVFAAKRRAELAPGVGDDTDLTIITADGVTHPAAGTVAQLDSINSEFFAARESGLADRIAELELEFATDEEDRRKKLSCPQRGRDK